MAKKSKQPDAGSYSHPSADRTNVPTEQVEALMSPDQREPLSFKPKGRVVGRDDQPVLAWQRDKQPTTTQYLAYPLYVKEKVHPGAFARWLQSGNAAQAAQQSMFEDFNGYPEDADKFEWYQHSGNWSNRLIHGESSQVMASLAKREGLAGQVQMIYFDPPYGISFRRTFQVATDNTNTRDNEKGLPNDPRTIRAFRDTYKRGLHSYLDEMLEKLTLARELLHESGSIFVQIGDDNVGRLMMLCDEVFGAENRIALIPYATSGASSANTLPSVADFLLYYARDRHVLKYRQLYEQLNTDEQISVDGSFSGVEVPGEPSRFLSTAERAGGWRTLPPEARLFRARAVASQGHAERAEGQEWGRSDPYELKENALESATRSIACPKGRQWSVSREGLDRLAEKNRIFALPNGQTMHMKWYFDEIPGRQINNIWHSQQRVNSKRFVVQTAEETIERALLMSTDPGDLVMDITCGSGTTASVAEEWGRRWITCDTSPVSIAIARQRIAAQTFTYHVLQDSKNGVEEEAKIVSELGGTPADVHTGAKYGNDPSKGFVLNRVPYVTVKTLAYDLPQTYTYLVDQPVKARGKVRLASPFTVESATSTAFDPISSDLGASAGTAAGSTGERDVATDSNSRAATSDETDTDPATSTDGEASVETAPELGFVDSASRRYVEFSERTIDALRANGASDTSGDRTLQIVEIDRLPSSQWISHAVVYNTDEGTARAGLLIAPEGAAVHRDTIRQAAIDTRNHIPNAQALLVVAYESEQGTQLHTDAAQGNDAAAGDYVGPVQVLHVRPHRDLQLNQLADDPEHRAFTLLGEPDIEVRSVDKPLSGTPEVVIELCGFDTYNPATGATDHGGPGQVTCWMIDTDFNGESFFARRLHFPGGEKDMKKLAKALGVGLDDLRFKATLTTTSAPIPVPERGRMAVRIITTTGDEMTVEIPNVTAAADKTL